MVTCSNMNDHVTGTKARCATNQSCTASFPPGCPEDSRSGDDGEGIAWKQIV